MRGRYLGGLLVLLATPVALTQSATTASMTLQPASRLWVEGTSTVRSFRCTAGDVRATVEAKDGAAAAVLAGEKAIGRVELTVATSSLDCANGTMNDHMFKALKASVHPRITFRLISYELTPAGADSAAVTLDGRLTLGGVEKPVTMKASAAAGHDGMLLVSGSQSVKLSDHGLKAPTLMLGTMRVGDQVKVRYELVLKS